MILLECQYCIEGTAHAVLILPDTATFQVVNDSASVSTQGMETGCFAVDSFNGRQTVICRAQENSSMTLDICPDGVNCTQLLVELQSCPQTAQPGTTNTPGADGSTTSTPATGETATQPVATTPTVTP